MSMKKYSLGIVQTHATQFDGPLFKRLSEYTEIDVTVYYTRPTGRAPLDSELGRSPNWDNEVLSRYRCKTREVGFWGSVRFLSQVMNSNHDLIVIGGYIPFYHFLIAICARLRGMAVGLRSDTVMLYSKSAYSVKSILKRLVMPYVFKVYSFGHPVGTLAKQYLLHYGFPKNRIFRFPYAVDNDYLASRCGRYRLRRDHIRRALGIEPDSFVVIGIVKFVEREDPMTLLLGFAKLLNHCPTAHLVLIGDGSMMREIKTTIKEKAIPNVHLPGFVRYSRLPLFYSIADVFVHPPVWESWGVSVNEAMACGLPVVVASTVGSHVDLVEPGKTGFIFEARNPEDLADCLVKLSFDSALRKKMGNNAKKLIEDWNYDYVEESLLRALTRAKNDSGQAKVRLRSRKKCREYTSGIEER